MKEDKNLNNQKASNTSLLEALDNIRTWQLTNDDTVMEENKLPLVDTTVDTVVNEQSKFLNGREQLPLENQTYLNGLPQTDFNHSKLSDFSTIRQKVIEDQAIVDEEQVNLGPSFKFYVAVLLVFLFTIIGILIYVFSNINKEDTSLIASESALISSEVLDSTVATNPWTHDLLESDLTNHLSQDALSSSSSQNADHISDFSFEADQTSASSLSSITDNTFTQPSENTFTDIQESQISPSGDLDDLNSSKETEDWEREWTEEEIESYLAQQ